MSCWNGDVRILTRLPALVSVYCLLVCVATMVARAILQDVGPRGQAVSAAIAADCPFGRAFISGNGAHFASTHGSVNGLRPDKDSSIADLCAAHTVPRMP